jgi:hypothetical protein
LRRVGLMSYPALARQLGQYAGGLVTVRFTKLDITSRSQLDQALPTDPAPV